MESMKDDSLLTFLGEDGLELSEIKKAEDVNGLELSEIQNSDSGSETEEHPAPASDGPKSELDFSFMAEGKKADTFAFSTVDSSIDLERTVDESTQLIEKATSIINNLTNAFSTININREEILYTIYPTEDLKNLDNFNNLIQQIEVLFSNCIEETDPNALEQKAKALMMLIQLIIWLTKDDVALQTKFEKYKAVSVNFLSEINHDKYAIIYNLIQLNKIWIEINANILKFKLVKNQENQFFKPKNDVFTSTISGEIETIEKFFQRCHLEPQKNIQQAYKIRNNLSDKIEKWLSNYSSIDTLLITELNSLKRLSSTVEKNQFHEQLIEAHSGLVTKINEETSDLTDITITNIKKNIEEYRLFLDAVIKRVSDYKEELVNKIEEILANLEETNQERPYNKLFRGSLEQILKNYFDQIKSCFTGTVEGCEKLNLINGNLDKHLQLQIRKLSSLINAHNKTYEHLATLSAQNNTPLLAAKILSQANDLFHHHFQLVPLAINLDTTEFPACAPETITPIVELDKQLEMTINLLKDFTTIKDQLAAILAPGHKAPFETMLKKLYEKFQNPTPNTNSIEIIKAEIQMLSFLYQSYLNSKELLTSQQNKFKTFMNNYVKQRDPIFENLKTLWENQLNILEHHVSDFYNASFEDQTHFIRNQLTSIAQNTDESTLEPYDAIMKSHIDSKTESISLISLKYCEFLKLLSSLNNGESVAPDDYVRQDVYIKTRNQLIAKLKAIIDDLFNKLIINQQSESPTEIASLQTELNSYTDIVNEAHNKIGQCKATLANICHLIINIINTISAVKHELLDNEHLKKNIHNLRTKYMGILNFDFGGDQNDGSLQFAHDIIKDAHDTFHHTLQTASDNVNYLTEHAFAKLSLYTKIKDQDAFSRFQKEAEIMIKAFMDYDNLILPQTELKKLVSADLANFSNRIRPFIDQTVLEETLIELNKRFIDYFDFSLFFLGNNEQLPHVKENILTQQLPFITNRFRPLDEIQEHLTTFTKETCKSSASANLHSNEKKECIIQFWQVMNYIFRAFPNKTEYLPTLSQYGSIVDDATTVDQLLKIYLAHPVRLDHIVKIQEDEINTYQNIEKLDEVAARYQNDPRKNNSILALKAEFTAIAAAYYAARYLAPSEDEQTARERLKQEISKAVYQCMGSPSDAAKKMFKNVDKTANFLLDKHTDPLGGKKALYVLADIGLAVSSVFVFPALIRKSLVKKHNRSVASVNDYKGFFPKAKTNRCKDVITVETALITHARPK